VHEEHKVESERKLANIHVSIHQINYYAGYMINPYEVVFS